MPKVILDKVTLTYPVFNSKNISLRNELIRIGTGGRLSKESGNIINVTALDNISLELTDGDSVGLIGHNGAGKSSLLRLIAGIYSATRGKLRTEGEVTALLELGAGLEPELSGYENIIRMGLLLGYSKAQMNSVIPHIEEFSELGDFLKAPVRTYSAGMVMRLMFSVVTQFDPEIFLVDEIFGVGDQTFQKKATARMEEMIEKSKIFIIASHSEELIHRYCNKIIVLEHGRIKSIQ